MKNSIKNKLAAGFGLWMLLMVVVVGFNFSALQRLDKLYQETLKRSVDMELATDARHIGEDLYPIIANAVINRDMAKSERDWSTAKTENLAKLQKVALAADTPEEHAKVKETREAFEDIIRIYEQEMLPLILKGAVVPGPLADIDARIDTKIEVINQALEWVAKSISDENQKSSREFHAVLVNSIRFGLTISLIGLDPRSLGLIGMRERVWQA
jgi:methyl-accepting chemotaxis protein